MSENLKEHLPEGIEPGDGWVCDEGHRHFQCGVCEDVFTSNPEFTQADAQAEQQSLGMTPASEDAEDDDDKPWRVCDDCHPIVLAKLRAQGIVV